MPVCALGGGLLGTLLTIVGLLYFIVETLAIKLGVGEAAAVQVGTEGGISAPLILLGVIVAFFWVGGSCFVAAGAVSCVVCILVGSMTKLVGLRIPPVACGVGYGGLVGLVFSPFVIGCFFDSVLRYSLWEVVGLLAGGFLIFFFEVCGAIAGWKVCLQNAAHKSLDSTIRFSFGVRNLLALLLVSSMVLASLRIMGFMDANQLVTHLDLAWLLVFSLVLAIGIAGSWPAYRLGRVIHDWWHTPSWDSHRGRVNLD